MPNLVDFEGRPFHFIGIGGIGMSWLCDIIKPGKLRHITLMIALDRQNVGEYVTYNDFDNKVHEYIQSFGFNKNIGSFSDCQIFTERYKIPSVNVSVGYHGQHTTMERLHIDELYLTVERILKILDKPIKKRHKVYKPRPIYSRYFKEWDNAMPTYGTCEFCNQLADNLHSIEGMIVCNNCYQYIKEGNNDLLYGL